MWLVKHILWGIRWNIPICCTLRFAWEARYVPQEQAVQRGVCLYEHGVYVPCLVFHQAHYPFDEHSRRTAAKYEALDERRCNVWA